MIKTECIVSKLESSRSFPKVMTRSQYTVLFTKSGVGTVIHKNALEGTYMVGDHQDTWNMSDFKDTDNKITITSKEL
jgi:hypothetical protein